MNSVVIVVVVLVVRCGISCCSDWCIDCSIVNGVVVLVIGGFTVIYNKFVLGGFIRVNDTRAISIRLLGPLLLL